MKFVASKLLEEGTSYYSLSDGTVLGVKLVVTKVKRVLNPDGSELFMPNGNPAYSHDGQVVTVTLSPDEYERVRKN